MGSFIFLSLLMLTVVMSVHGQISLVPTCRVSGSDALVTINVAGGIGKYVQILGCATQEGPLTTDPEDADMASCPLDWDEPYQVYVKANVNVTLGSDHNEELNCTRNTDDQTVSQGLTVITSAPTAFITDEVEPVPGILITDNTEDWDGTALPTATIGDPLRLHLFLTLPFQDSFGILAFRITVTSPAGTVDLVLNGCQQVAWFGHVQQIDDAILRVDFNAFMLAPGTQTEDIQEFDALLEVCAPGPCPAYDCTAGPFGPTMQYGRRRREVSNDTIIEEVRVQGKVRINPFPLETETEVDVNVNEGQTAKVEECEVCMQKSVMYGVTTVLVLALILSLAVSCFLFVRARKSRKILREDSELTGSANPAYRR